MCVLSPTKYFYYILKDKFEICTIPLTLNNFNYLLKYLKENFGAIPDIRRVFISRSCQKSAGSEQKN